MASSLAGRPSLREGITTGPSFRGVPERPYINFDDQHPLGEPRDPPSSSSHADDFQISYQASSRQPRLADGAMSEWIRLSVTDWRLVPQGTPLGRSPRDH